eukprot:242-Rhodomonas_salina.1
MKGKDEFVVCKGKGFKLDVERKARADLVQNAPPLQVSCGACISSGDLLAPCFCMAVSFLPLPSCVPSYLN